MLNLTKKLHANPTVEIDPIFPVPRPLGEPWNMPRDAIKTLIYSQNVAVEIATLSYNIGTVVAIN